MNPHFPQAAANYSAAPSGSGANVQAELSKELRMGAQGTETDAREIRRIDLSDFENRFESISDALWDAAVDVGFFQIVHHGIDLAHIRESFARAEDFFALPQETKALYPLRKALNVGWESRAQVRPATGTPDQKESYQITRPHMQELWPSEGDLPGFRAHMLGFEAQCWQVAMRVLSCFAHKLGFERDFFSKAHDPQQPSYQSTLRLLHYFAMTPESLAASGLWRAGAHTDFDCLTLLFQRDGQGGLQVCPGKDMESQAWTSVQPDEAVITCNVGDMLMRWSDDQLPSNFHRVRNPAPGESLDARYSMAFFAQANRDAVIAGPGGKYPPMAAGDYLNQRIAANFKAH